MEPLETHNGLRVSHLMLCEANSQETAEALVLRFLERCELISYDETVVNSRETCCAAVSEFWELVDAGLEVNRREAAEILSELVAEGYTAVSDLADIPQGYLSKQLHTVAHLQDGFFGIDSAFYNLAEDSHQISQRLRQHIMQHPESYWVIEVQCVSYNQEDAFEALKKQLIGKQMSSDAI